MEFIHNGRPLIKSFFERITEEQLKSLKSGSPDEATKILLAELILDMIRSVTSSVLTALKNIYNPESEEEDQPSVDQVTSQISSQALGIDDKVDSVSSRSLSDLLAEEVRRNVDSALSSGLQNLQFVIDQNVTHPHRISAMVLHATKVLRELSMKMKTIFAPRLNREREESLIREHVSFSPVLREEPGLYDTDGPQARSSVGRKSPETVSSNESFRSKTPQRFQEDISKDLSDILTPLLEELPEREFKKLQSEITEELQILSDQVGQMVCASDRDNWKEARLMIKEFLAKSFAKVWIHRFLIQLKKKHQQYSDIDSSALAESLVATCTSLTQLEMDEKEDENKDSLTLLFRRISSSTILLFTKQLSDLIYPHFLPQTVPDSLKGSQSLRNLEAMYTDTYADIQSKVWVFVVLLNWWLKTQTLSEKANIPTAQIAAPSQEEARRANATLRYQEAQQEAEPQLDRKSMLVKLLIDKVLWEMYCDVKMLPEKKDDIATRLFESVWAEVRLADVFVTVKNLKSTSMKIYRQLCKMWTSADQLLCLLISQDPTTEIYVASVFKGHLTTPATKPSYIRTFFSSLGRAVARPFRNTDKTHIPFFEILS